MIHRVLRVDKASGPTSHDAVDWVRRLLRQRRVGHAGTLDPLATGLLLVCAGRATKIAPLLSDLDKVYQARVRLGVATDTGDAEGAVIGELPVHNDIALRLDAVLPRFLGAIEQVPPMASAIRVGGERLHRLRRAGIAVERPPRTVHVHAIDILGLRDSYLDLRITCGKGTYIRTLAADIAGATGTLGHLAGLRRESIGPFNLDGAVASDQLAKSDPEEVLARAGMSLSEALAHIPALCLNDDAAYAVRHGIVPRMRDISNVSASLKSGDLGRLEGPDGELVAVIVASATLDMEKVGRDCQGEGRGEAPAPLRFRRVLIGRTES